MYGHQGAIDKLLAAIFCLCLFSGIAAADPIRLLAFGDSLTQGYGLPPEDGLVPQLEGWLKDHGADVKVLNAGVSGDTTSGGLARLEWSLADKPDAMMLTLGGNDLLRGLDPTLSRANLDAMLKIAADRNLPVLLVGISAPDNYGADYKSAFDSIYPDLARKYGITLYPSLLEPLEKAGDRQQVLATLMQPDGIHPNADGVALIVANLGPIVLKWITGIKK